MGGVNQCSAGLSESGGRVVVLAFKLAKSEIIHSPDRIEKALTTPKVQAEIHKALTAFVVKKGPVGPTAMGATEAKELAKALKKPLSTAGDQVLDQIKKDPKFKKLEKGLDNLKASFRCTPVGVFVDKNAWVVYVVGVAAALGAGAALYVTKTGGPAVDLPVGLLKGKHVQVLQVGGFTLKGGLLEFKPDKRELGAEVLAVQKLERVQIKLKMGVVAAGSEITKVQGQAVVKADSFSISADAKGAPQDKKVDLGVGFDFKSGSLPGPFRVRVGAVVTDGKLTSGNVGAGMRTPVGDFALKGSAGKHDLGMQEYRGVLTYSIPLSL